MKLGLCLSLHIHLNCRSSCSVLISCLCEISWLIGHIFSRYHNTRNQNTVTRSRLKVTSIWHRLWFDVFITHLTSCKSGVVPGDGYFCQLKKQLTNHSFVGVIRNGHVTFLHTYQVSCMRNSNIKKGTKMATSVDEIKAAAQVVSWLVEMNFKLTYCLAPHETCLVSCWISNSRWY